MNKFCDVVGHGFFHAVPLVIFHGMNAQVQLFSDHFAAQSSVAKPDYFHFPLC